MDKVFIQLTVFFDDPFWVGVVEKNENQQLTVSKVTFGLEPKENEVYEWIYHNYDRLMFSPAVENVVVERKKSPKRKLREVKKQCSNTGIGTKSQQALKLQHEKFKQERKHLKQIDKESEKKRLFDLKQQKRKEKHKGR